jgi:selenocysteine lyase/cysteine desulfurase
MAVEGGPGAELDVEAVRREIPGVEGVAYLNTGGLGLMPAAARAELIGHYERLGPAIDPTSWYRECVGLADGLRARIAGFVGARADEIALKTSVADGFGSVLWGLDWRPGDEVLVVSEEHPSPRMAVELAARRFGLRVRTVPLRPTGAAFLDEVDRALGPRTRLSR